MNLLLDSAWKATVLLALAWAAVGCLRGKAAALRHRVWALALTTAVLAPALSGLPGWHSRVLTAESRVAAGVVETVAVQTVTVRGERSSAGFIVAVWAAGFCILMLRLPVGILWLRWRARPLTDEGRLQAARELAPGFGVARPVRLLTSRSSRAMPVTWGFLRPCILLPPDAAVWSGERLRIVLSHELAHIGRGDWGWQIWAEFARAVYWFHPLAWVAARRLRQESERACDDAVLNSGIRAADYADELLDMSRTLKTSGRLCATALAMARTSDLERRFTDMLNPFLNRRRLSRTAQFVTAIAALVVLIPIASLRAPAQARAGTFTGSVNDPAGAVVPNVTVIMTNKQAQTKDITTSGADGRFSFSGLPAGTYEMQAMAPGFQVFIDTGVTLEAGQDVGRDVSLALGAVNEKVNVTASGTKAPNAVRAGQPTRLRVGGNVQATKLLNMVKPVYPEAARAAGIEGTVILQAVIGVDGSLTSLRVLNSQIDPDLASAAMDAVQQWRYQPTLLNGQPAEVTTNITVNFKLS